MNIKIPKTTEYFISFNFTPAITYMDLYYTITAVAKTAICHVINSDGNIIDYCQLISY